MWKLSPSGRKAIEEAIRRSFTELQARTAILREKATIFLGVKASDFAGASEGWCLGPQTSSGMVRGTAIALWGAVAGATIASLVVYCLIQVSEPGRGYFWQNLEQYPVLDDYKKSALTKSAEKNYYVLFYVLGVICAAAALRFQQILGRVPALAFLAAATACIPALHILIPGITQRSDISRFALLFIAAALSVPALASHFGYRLADDARRLDGSRSSIVDFDPKLLRTDLYVVLALALLIVPLKIGYLAAQAFAGNHAVSFLVGPALYAFADGMLPGRDFLAFYGQGPSYLFRPFLSTDPAAVYWCYVVFLSALVLAFHVSCYFVLRDFYRDRAVACVIAVALIFTYHFGASGVYWGPSSLPIRFALVFVLAAATVRAMTSSSPTLWLLLSGVIVGISVFWNTETGILMFVAVLAAYGANELYNRKLPWRLFFFIVSTITAFLALCVGAFGFNVLSESFFALLFEPIRLHTAGNWVGIVMKWEPGSAYAYQIGAPAVAIATGMAALTRTRDAEPSLDLERAYLILFSILALVFTVKWINRSLDAGWWQNSFAFLVIGAWWARIALRGAYSYFPFKSVAAGLVVASMSIALLTFWNVTDRHQPNIKIGLRAYLEFPAAINLERLLRRDDYSMSVPMDASDVNLVNSLLKPGEPMLLLSNQDWLVLMKLGRAPKSYFLPLRDTFSLEHLARSFEGAKYLFVDKGADFSYEWLKVAFQDRVHREYRLVGESTRLQAYRRMD